MIPGRPRRDAAVGAAADPIVAIDAVGKTLADLGGGELAVKVRDGWPGSRHGADRATISVVRGASRSVDRDALAVDCRAAAVLDDVDLDVVVAAVGRGLGAVGIAELDLSS